VSVYAVNKICYLSERDADFRERARINPRAAVESFKLTPAERTALLAGDVATLFTLGAHPFLMQHLARHGLFGLDRDTYRTRITALAPPRAS
jgi:hypothetical protein